MNTDDPSISQGPPGSLKRPSYEAGNHLFAEDLLAEQRYRLLRAQRHNRYLHNWGVICGLWVVPAAITGQPWAIQICPGCAIGCCGEEIIVPTPKVVDIRNFLWKTPPDEEVPQVAYIGIRYAEYLTRLVPASRRACGCEETIYEASRIRDSFQINVLWIPPAGNDADEFDLCQRALARCPECTDHPYVLLAGIELPRSKSDPITKQQIHNVGYR